jgi:hypothetical protein
MLKNKLYFGREKRMKPIRNIVNLKVNNVSSNGSINFGPTIHKGLNANSKEVGGQSVIGDGNFAWSNEKNIISDPDIVDQPSKR